MNRTQMADALGLTRGRLWQILNADRPAREQLWEDDQVILDPQLYDALVAILDRNEGDGEPLVNIDVVESA
jgi:hypothetical protein